MSIANEKPKVVLDTNVFISALNYSGKPGAILALLLRREIEVYLSSFILDELRRILSEKFHWSQQSIERTLSLLKQKTFFVTPQKRVSIIKEKVDDNRILECGLEGKVQYIISGDRRHLLPLKTFQGIKILSPAEFLSILQS